MHARAIRVRVIRTIGLLLLAGALALSLVACTGTVKSGGSSGGGKASASDDPVEAAKAYKITDVKIEKLAEGLPTVTVTGKLTNNGTKTYKVVTISADLYKGGAKIDVPDGMAVGYAANDLKPGTSQEFSVTFMAADSSQDAAMAKALEADEAKVVIEVATSFEN